jgi:nonsense-mediated mRNA decay protein 3
MEEAGFCVVCGRTDQLVLDGLCVDCDVKRTPLVGAAAKAKVVLCPTCGSRQLSEKWEKWEGTGSTTHLGAEDLAPFLRPREGVTIRTVAWEERGTLELRREIDASLAVRYRETERTAHVAFPVVIEHRTCTSCGRKTGHFFTAIIQLRGPEGRLRGSGRERRVWLQETWDRVLPEARPEWRKALSWYEEKPEGWDIYVVDTEAARSLARWMKPRLNAKLTESPTLYGRHDGRDVYRVTYCLRVPAPNVPTRERVERQA